MIHLSIILFRLLIIIVILIVAAVATPLIDIFIVPIIVDGSRIIVVIVVLIPLDPMRYSAGTGFGASLWWGAAVVSIAINLNFLIEFCEPFYGVEFDEFEATFV